MNARTLIGVVLALSVGGLVYAFWPSPKRVPEDEIRLLVARAVAAAEHRDVGAFSDCIAEDFHTSELPSKQELKRLVAGYFFQNQNPMVVLNPALDVQLVSPKEAIFKGSFVFGRGPGAEVGDGASKYEIDAEVQLRDGQWKVTSAKWRR